MASTRETTHVRPDFGNNYFGCAAGDPRNGIEQSYRFCKGRTILCDLGIEVFDGFIYGIDLAQQLGKNEAMMRFDAPGQRLRQLLPFGGQSPFGKSAMVAASAWPAMSAANIARAERPTTFEATEASLIFAPSRVF